MKIERLTGLESKAVKRFADQVREYQRDNLVLMKLFGSRARGEGDEDSDVDVLVLLKKCDHKIKTHIWDLANDIYLDTWINISPLVMTDEGFHKTLKRERLIAKDIERDGILL